MENKKKELDFEGLEKIAGGTDEQSKELMEFLKKHYSDSSTGQLPNLIRLLRDNGISAVDRKSTRLNSSHAKTSRMPSSA